MYLVKKNKENEFLPAFDSDATEAHKIKVGETVKVSRARNVLHLKKFFAILRVGLANQDKITENEGGLETYRQIILLRSGFYHEVPDKHGNPYFIPKSIAFDKCSQEEFQTVYGAAIAVIAADMGITVEQLENESKNYM